MPVVSVLSLLAVYIGYPFFILSTTSSLAQQWYAATHTEEPYGLYAISNIGSFLALISYPFFIESVFTLIAQEVTWVCVFLAFVARYVYIAQEVETVATTRRKKDERPSWKALVMWAALASYPAFILVAATTHITSMIVPVPLLWVIPLGLYLLSFVIAFSDSIGVGVWAVLLLVMSFMLRGTFDAGYQASLLQVCESLAFVGVVGLAFHTALFNARPHHSQTAYFYAAVAAGGMLGTLVGSLAMPLVLSTVSEFYWSIGVSAVLAIVLLPRVVFQARGTGMSVILRSGVAILVAIMLLGTAQPSTANILYASRNFYGAVRVQQFDKYVSLVHGNTLHGSQSILPEFAKDPSSYYTTDSGVGRTMRAIESHDAAVSVGVIGLGTGSLATYCRPGDTFTFYEIDPRIISVAATYFSYLRDCPKVRVVIGDARLSLEEQGRQGNTQQYDVLAVDAFSSDSIPMHLLTKEAVALYLDQVKQDGTVAIHVSNRYLDLAPVVHRIAHELHVPAITVLSDGTTTPLGTASSWVLLNRNPHFFLDSRFADIDIAASQKEGPLWTDDKNALSSVLLLPYPPLIAWFMHIFN
jgi:hypothetical protein